MELHRGLMTVKRDRQGKVYVSLYDGDSWIQRDTEDEVRKRAEELGIEITEIRRQK
jgi:hypothetical protein